MVTSFPDQRITDEEMSLARMYFEYDILLAEALSIASFI